MSYPYYDLVQKAHADLKAEGLIKPRSDQAQVEEDKGLLTRRAAYYINTQQDSSIGLLEKTSGNNSQGYSVDWHVRNTDGEGWDVATDVEVNGLREAAPVNGSSHGANPDNIPRWRQPTAELAQMPDGGQPNPEPEPEPPPANNDEILAKLDVLTEAVTALQVIVAGQSEQIHHMMTQTWHGECALGRRMNFGVTCPPMP